MNEQRLWRLPEHLCLFCHLCTCSYDNHDKCTCRVHYCLAIFQTLFFHSFMHHLPKTWSPNQNFEHVTDQLQVKPCQKLRLFETICSLPTVREVDDFLLVFCPYLDLEFFTSLLWQLFASLKYIVDGLTIHTDRSKMRHC